MYIIHTLNEAIINAFTYNALYIISLLYILCGIILIRELFSDKPNEIPLSKKLSNIAKSSLSLFDNRQGKDNNKRRVRLITGSVFFNTVGTSIIVIDERDPSGLTLGQIWSITPNSRFEVVHNNIVYVGVYLDRLNTSMYPWVLPVRVTEAHIVQVSLPSLYLALNRFNMQNDHFYIGSGAYFIARDVGNFVRVR